MTSISLIIIELFKLPISYWMSCDSLCFCRIGPFLPWVKVLCIKLFTVYPYYSFDIYMVYSGILCFIPDIFCFLILFLVLLEVCQISLIDLQLFILGCQLLNSLHVGVSVRIGPLIVL